MLNKKMTIMMVVSVAVISGMVAAVYSVQTPMEKLSQPEQPSPLKGGAVPAFPIMSLTDTPVATIQKAKQLTNFKIDEPSYLPSGYNIDVINVTPDRRSVTILASPKEVTAETSNYKFFWEDKGILIYYNDETGTGFNWERDSPSFGQSYGSHQATINGNPIVVHGQAIGKGVDGSDIPIMAELMMYRDGWTIVIRADLPEGELIRVAQSMY